ncbi:hypothetical protein BRL57_22825 [Bordetella bronchiseptica]|nr:hypothetical protein [Bordetella bronchiseptica]
MLAAALLAAALRPLRTFIAALSLGRLRARVAARRCGWLGISPAGRQPIGAACACLRWLAAACPITLALPLIRDCRRFFTRRRWRAAGHLTATRR